MKNKIRLLLVSNIILVFFLLNSCKKATDSTITTIFTDGSWQLASVLVTTTVKSISTVDTLNTKCDSTQVFVFNTGGTCTYTNYDCVPQKVSGQWSLSADQLTLYANITCKDTTSVGHSTPFGTAQIVNAGQYSLVLQTGNYNVVPTTTNTTKVTRYGFIRQKTSIK